MTEVTPATTAESKWLLDLWIIAAITIVFFGLSRWHYSGHSRYVEVGRGEVVYASGTKKATALKVGRLLHEMKIFDGRNRKTVGLGFIDGRYELRLPIAPEIAQFLTSPAQQANPQVQLVRQQVTTVCRKAFGETPAVVRLTDEHLVPHTKLLSLP